MMVKSPSIEIARIMFCETLGCRAIREHVFSRNVRFNIVASCLSQNDGSRLVEPVVDILGGDERTLKTDEWRRTALKKINVF